MPVLNLKSLIVRKGEVLRRTTYTVGERKAVLGQLILELPRWLEIRLWKDERTSNFHIEVLFPSDFTTPAGYATIIPLASFEGREEAEERYARLVEGLREGKAWLKINVGNRSASILWD